MTPARSLPALGISLLLLLHLSPLSAEAPPTNTSTNTSSTLLTPGTHTIPCVEQSLTACARVYLPSFLDASSASLLLSLSTSAFSLTPGGSGPVTLIDLVSGALSYQDRFINAFPLFARQQTFFPLPALSLYLQLTSTIRTHIHRTLNLTFPLYLTRPSFIAQISAHKPFLTTHDEYFHPHVDLHQYGSFDFTALIYLSEWGEDFTGGEFVFTDTKRGERQSSGEEAEVKAGGDARVEGPSVGGAGSSVEEVEVRPSRGGVLYFTSGEENVHYVRKVVTGQRSTLTIAFTKNEEASVEAQLHEKYGQRLAEWREQQELQKDALDSGDGAAEE